MSKNFDNESDKPHFSNKVSVDNFNKSAGTEQLPQANTDFFVDLLINPDKVISPDKRWSYDKNDIYSQQNVSFNDNNTNDINNDNDNDNYNYSDKKDYHTTEKDTFSDKQDFTEKFDEKKNDMVHNKEEKQKSKEELLLEKLDMLRKLCELKEAGVNISQNYNMNSDYNMMKYEYELHKGIRSKQNAVNWMSSMSLNCIYGLEMLNDKYNPFDLKLKGWSEQMNADINNYYDVFGDLYEKYNKPGKQMAPEIKLLLMLSGSALKFHLSNTVVNSLPNLGDTINNNPELANKLRQKAVADKLKQQSDLQRNSLNNYANKEHDIAAQKATDLQMLKERELEHLKMQQNLLQQKQYNDLQQKLKQQPIVQQPVLRPPVMPQFNKSSVSPEDFELFKKQQLLNQYTQMQQIKNLENKINTETDKSNKSSKSTKSSKSIHISDIDNNSEVLYNKDLDDIIQRSTNKMIEKSYDSYDDDSKKSNDISIGSKNSKKNTRKKSVIKIM
jgi:hypothetical protein